MSNPALPLFALLALAPVAADQPRDTAIGSVEMAQLTFHSRIVIRIPRMIDPRRRDRPERPVRLEEKKGPKCVPLTTLDRAIITGRDSIDLLLETGERIRARFDDTCPALDFYPDLYLRLPDDEMLCAGRDAIRSRSGGVCPIRSFRTIVERR